MSTFDERAELDEDSFLDEAFGVDPSARDFVHLVTDVLHFFDDVADGDVPLTRGYSEGAAWAALVELPRNAFYARHFAELNPLLAVAIQNWTIANQIEENDEGPRFVESFILRSSYVDVLTLAATLLRGRQAGAALGHELRRRCHAEGLDGYRAGLAKQAADAAALRRT